MPRTANLGRAMARAAELESLASHLLGASALAEASEPFAEPVLVHDGSRLVFVNSAGARWLEYESRDALIGTPLGALSAPEDRRSLTAALGAGPEGPPAKAHVQRFCTRRGRVVIANVLARAHEYQGRAAVLVVVEPGSPVHRSSSLLRLLEEAIDHLHDIVFITEAESIDGVGRRIVFVNRRYSLVTGYEAVDVLGKTPNVTVGEETDRRTLVRIEEGLRAKRAVHEELLKYGKDGATYWVELDILPVFDEEGEHTHWVSVQRDITERKALQDELVETERLASVGLLAANLASEINNPLAAVSSSLEWIAEQLAASLGKEAGTENGRALLDAVADARAGTQRMAAATSYLRLLAGADDRELAPTDVHEVLDTALALLRAARHIPATILREYGTVPPVVADASRLVHVFHLALKNAVDSLAVEREKNNSITIRTSAASGGVLVTITDTGAGIPVEVADKLFRPFVTTKTRGTGGGLGLFIANRLVTEVGGRIHIRTREEGGSLFEVLLPAHPDAMT